MIGYVVLVLVALFGSVIQGITGMGYSMVSMAIMTFFFSYKEYAIAVKILSFIFFAPVLFYYRKEIQFKVLLVPLLTSLVSTYFGYQMFAYFPESTLKIILGILLIIVSLFFLLYKKEIHIKPSVKNGMIAGVCAGITTGTCNVPGPPLAIYYLNCIKNDKRKYFATITTHFFLNGIFQMFLFASGTGVSKNSLKFTLIALVPTIMGYFVGRKLFKKFDSKIITKSVYVLMVVMGISIIVFN